MPIEILGRHTIHHSYGSHTSIHMRVEGVLAQERRCIYVVSL